MSTLEQTTKYNQGTNLGYDLLIKHMHYPKSCLIVLRADIEKGLVRLNAAWQSLKKEKESYQRAQELYEAFYAWLQARASFSLDTTTGFYRLDTNETGTYELQKDNIIEPGRN